MLKSIATVSVSGPLDAKLRAIAQAGFAGVEIFENDLLASPDSPRQVGAILRDLGLVCTVYQPFRDFEGLPAPLRQRAFERAERKFDVMQELGAGLMLVCSSVAPAALPERARIVDDFRELGERAAKRGLRVGYEALAWGRHINDHRDAWAVVKAVDHPAIGIILDSFHSLARAVPTDSLRWIEPGRIFIVQIADAPVLAMDPLSWSRHFRCMPGQGDLPLVDYVATLQDIGYEGPLSLEIFNDRFRAGSTTEVALDGMRSLIYLEEQVAQRPGTPPASEPAQPRPRTQQGPRAHPASQPLPARARCQGVEFIEFCATPSEAELLGAMLEATGFQRAGRHRRKAVTRWRQGDINLVINCEPAGFAHEFNQEHGTSVCAIGLRVDAVDEAMARASGLRMSTFSQPVGPGEFAIPAIRGVGGSLIYFVASGEVASIWDAEFEALPSQPGGDAGAGAGLRRVDHFTQSMQFEEMLSWLLYYVALFDVSKAPQIEIADPVGLVTSQVVQGRDGKFRVTLNGSAAAQTLAARFLHNYAGAGVQHIAFESGDIFATARALRAAGMQPLPIPPNYYADLGARFGLDAPLLGQLEEFNILYDRDGDGEYFQLFSRAFAKRFFFEIVERRGYDGYGAANAPIRLAAQSRYRADGQQGR